MEGGRTEGGKKGGMKLEVLRKCSSLGPVGDGCGDFVNLYLGPAREQPTHQHGINPSTTSLHTSTELISKQNNSLI